jgi:XTP/dITP diphosphohydrolase
MRSDRCFVFASGNAGKLRELSALLAQTGIRLRPQAEFDLPEVDETGLTFVENALLKARAATAGSRLPAIADDSGLEVDALDGEPGIRSARFAGRQGDDQANNSLLLERLAGLPATRRTARFRCVIVSLAHPADPAPLICQGTWEGTIAEQPSGARGFGYDPVFVPRGMSVSAAELDPAVKNRLSHRGQALRKLIESLTAVPA